MQASQIPFSQKFGASLQESIGKWKLEPPKKNATKNSTSLGHWQPQLWPQLNSDILRCRLVTTRVNWQSSQMFNIFKMVWWYPLLEMLFLDARFTKLKANICGGRLLGDFPVSIQLPGNIGIYNWIAYSQFPHWELEVIYIYYIYRRRSLMVMLEIFRNTFWHRNSPIISMGPKASNSSATVGGT